MRRTGEAHWYQEGLTGRVTLNGDLDRKENIPLDNMCVDGKTVRRIAQKLIILEVDDY